MANRVFCVILFIFLFAIIYVKIELDIISSEPDIFSTGQKSTGPKIKQGDPIANAKDGIFNNLFRVKVISNNITFISPQKEKSFIQDDEISMEYKDFEYYSLERSNNNINKKKPMNPTPKEPELSQDDERESMEKMDFEYFSLERDSNAINQKKPISPTIKPKLSKMVFL